MFVPLIIILSTVRVVSVPTDVIFVCAAVVSVTSAIYVLIRDAAAFLFVPPAASSTTNRSASAIAAPISVPPSMSKAVSAKLLTDAVAPINFPSEALY